MSDITLDFSGLFGFVLIAACAALAGIASLGLALLSRRDGASPRLAVHARAGGIVALASAVLAALVYQAVESLWGPDWRPVRTGLDVAGLAWPIAAVLIWRALVRRHG